MLTVTVSISFDPLLVNLRFINKLEKTTEIKQQLSKSFYM